MFLFSLFSSMSTRKFEGRREKGIEGVSWGNDNKVGSTAAHLWTKTALDLSRTLGLTLLASLSLVRRVSASNYLLFPSPSVVTRSHMKKGDKETREGSSVPLHMTCIRRTWEAQREYRL